MAWIPFATLTPEQKDQVKEAWGTLLGQETYQFNFPAIVRTRAGATVAEKAELTSSLERKPI
jgi:hypothetical protein